MLLSLEVEVFDENNGGEFSTVRVADFSLDGGHMLALVMSTTVSNTGLVKQSNYFRTTFPCCGGDSSDWGAGKGKCPKAGGHLLPNQSRDLQVSHGREGALFNGEFIRRFLNFYLSIAYPGLHSIQVAILGEEILLQLDQSMKPWPVVAGSWLIATDFLNRHDSFPSA